MFGVQKFTLITIFFIGSGRLAVNLAHALKQCNDVKIAGVYSRNPEHAAAFAHEMKIPVFAQMAEIPHNCDVYFLAVSDAAIAGIAGQLRVSGLVVHCSGMMPLNSLVLQTHHGVFWPVQTFSKDLVISFNDIPVCIEAGSEEDLRILEAVADRITKKTVRVNEKQRQLLHLAAVVVNNFSNHLFTLAAQLLSSNGISFDLLKPLIRETSGKIQHLSPAAAQSGPAARADLETLARHEALLSSDPALLEIYRLLSSSIIDKNK